MKTIYIARYTDNRFPEDNEIFGARLTREAAQSLIDKELARYAKDSELNLSKPWNYSVIEVELKECDE